MLLSALLAVSVAGCNLLFPYQDRSPDGGVPAMDQGRDRDTRKDGPAPKKDRSKPKQDKGPGKKDKDSALDKAPPAPDLKPPPPDKGAATGAWTQLTLKGASWPSTVAPAIWGRSAKELFIAAGYQLYRCSDAGGKDLTCTQEFTSLNIIQAVGGYSGDVYAVGSNGMVAAKSKSWGGNIITGGHLWIDIWCDAVGNCTVVGIAAASPGGALVGSFKGTKQGPITSASNIKQFRAVHGAGNLTVVGGTYCNVRGLLSGGNYHTITFPGCSQHITGIWAVSATEFWAVGSAGARLRWTNNLTAKYTGLSTSSLNGVWGAGKNEVWAVGQAGTVLRWDGKGWKSHNKGVNASHNLNDVWGVGSNHLYAVGVSGQVWRYK